MTTPQETFEAFVHAAAAGKLGQASNLAEHYNMWADNDPDVHMCGEVIDGERVLATDSHGDDVVRCDYEQDRYGVAWGQDAQLRYVDKWRCAFREAELMAEDEQRRCEDDAREAMGEAQERNATRGDQ